MGCSRRAGTLNYSSVRTLRNIRAGRASSDAGVVINDALRHWSSEAEYLKPPRDGAYLTFPPRYPTSQRHPQHALTLAPTHQTTHIHNPLR
mmetsp:Transcript_13151/g.19816  ORF Transcript_13151/g.19816 Transcript_13151/m.19816 type:complete len:91 (+) Transcript_13151:139-411(+)